MVDSDIWVCYEVTWISKQISRKTGAALVWHEDLSCLCYACKKKSNTIAFSLEHIYTIFAKKMKLLLKTVLWCLKSHPQGLWWVKSHVNVNTFDLLEEPQHSCAFFSAPNGQALHSGQVSLDEGTHHPLTYVLPAPCSRRLHGAGQPAALGNAVQIMEGLWNPSPFKNPLSLKFFDACWSFFQEPYKPFIFPKRILGVLSHF